MFFRITSNFYYYISICRHDGTQRKNAGLTPLPYLWEWICVFFLFGWTHGKMWAIFMVSLNAKSPSYVLDLDCVFCVFSSKERHNPLPTWGWTLTTSRREEGTTQLLKKTAQSWSNATLWLVWRLEFRVYFRFFPQEPPILIETNFLKPWEDLGFSFSSRTYNHVRANFLPLDYP